MIVACQEAGTKLMIAYRLHFEEANLGRSRLQHPLSPRLRLQHPLAYELVVGEGKPQRKKFAKHDQFGAELEYFSDCILRDRDAEPSGIEGLADIRIVRAILPAIQEGGGAKPGR